MSAMQDDLLLRYSRHILLDAVGIEGQDRIVNSHVLLIGLGGLGSAASLYLAAAGVGQLTLVDHDRVELTNLQRQIAHGTADIGMPKVISAAQSMQQLNPHVQINTITEQATPASLSAWVADADVVLDCCDNYQTRQAINAACVTHRKPLVSAAATGWDGQISVFDSTRSDCPCYACVFPPTAQAPDMACATMGVLAPLVGIMGSMQAAEVLKIIVAAGSPLYGQLMLLDALDMQWTTLHTPRDSACTVCGMAQQV